MVTLNQVAPGAQARVESLLGPPEAMQRLYEFGLFEGEIIKVLNFAPLGDPIEISIGNTRLSIRKSEASFISVTLL